MLEAPSFPRLRLRGVTCIPVEVPLRYVLGTSAAVVRAAPLLLVELQTDEGAVGRSYVFAYRRSGAQAIALVLQDAAAVVQGEEIAPLAMAARLQRRFDLIGVTGVVRMALSALDMALWDALAVAAGAPLARLLGGAPRPLRTYNSCGLGLMAPEAAADEADALLEGGMTAVKLRLGSPTLGEDLAVTRAVRARLPDDVSLLVDYNQALSRVDALERGRALQHEGVAWLEEPIRHDDLPGNAEIARSLDVPLQLGENFDGPKDMLRALQAGACDLVMPDVARIGGAGRAPSDGELRLRDVARELAEAETSRRGFLLTRAELGSPGRDVAVQPLDLGERRLRLQVADDDDGGGRGPVEVAEEAQHVLALQPAEPLLAADPPAPDPVPVVQQLVQRFIGDRRRVVRLALRFLDDDLELAPQLVGIDQ
jgi:mandelate racemase